MKTPQMTKNITNSPDSLQYIDVSLNNCLLIYQRNNYIKAVSQAPMQNSMLMFMYILYARRFRVHNRSRPGYEFFLYGKPQAVLLHIFCITCPYIQSCHLLHTLFWLHISYMESYQTIYCTSFSQLSYFLHIFLDGKLQIVLLHNFCTSLS